MAAGRYRREEDEVARLDRHWAELLQELRVAQTGTQILFAFLLTIAFTARFATVDDLTRVVFTATLTVAAMATALLIAPVSFHRLVYRRRLRVELVHAAGWLATGGLVLLMLAMAGGLFIALDVALPRGGAVAVVGVVLVWFMCWWYVLPMMVRKRANVDRPSDLTRWEP